MGRGLGEGMDTGVKERDRRTKKKERRSSVTFSFFVKPSFVRLDR